MLLGSSEGSCEGDTDGTDVLGPTVGQLLGVFDGEDVGLEGLKVDLNDGTRDDGFTDGV